MSNIYEYSNSYNNSMSSYANLEKYNKASHFGPKLPPTTPSNNFPTILEQKPIASYDVLTLGSQTEYPGVKNAYGDSCSQKYFVAKCPSNKEIRPFNDHSVVTPAPRRCNVETEEIVEGFSDLKDLEVVVFVDMSGKCKFSNVLKSGGLDEYKAVVDINASPKNEQEFTNMGGYATPYFYSLKTNKSVTGLVSKDKLVEMLSYHEGYEHPMKKKVRDMKLKVYVMEMCGYCQKLKQMLEEAGITDDDVEYIKDLASHRHELQNVRGFPHIKSMKTGKEMTGYPGSMENLMKQLH